MIHARDRPVEKMPAIAVFAILLKEILSGRLLATTLPTSPKKCIPCFLNNTSGKFFIRPKPSLLNQTNDYAGCQDKGAIETAAGRQG